MASNNRDNNLDIAPPKERPPTSTAVPTSEALGLSLVLLKNGKPLFPLSVLQARFNEGSEERAEIAALQAEFEKEFGGTSPGSTKGGDAHRASALCDFSIDEGLRPLDCKRVVDLPAKPISDFSDERPVGRNVFPFVIDANGFYLADFG